MYGKKDECECMKTYEGIVRKRVLKKRKRQQKIKSNIKVVKTRKNLNKVVIDKVKINEK
tara:strand:+ start:371 stop:547 length:177 start_codon:yes stop_codon:yes gene_type:complete